MTRRVKDVAFNGVSRSGIVRYDVAKWRRRNKNTSTSTAAKAGVAMEINSYAERLDLNDIYARRAAELGIPLSINTDAHRPEHLAFRSLGVGIARRAWITSKQVVNCWTAARMQKWLKARG